MAKRSRHTSAQMRKRMEAWRSSGLSLREWADREGLKYETARRWRKRSESPRVSGQSTDLVPIVVHPAEKAQPLVHTLEVALDNGLCLRIPHGTDEQEICRVVQALRQC